MLPLENYLFSATGPKPNQDTIPAGVTLAGDFGFCFQCQVGSSLVLHRPIEITRLTGQVKSNRWARGVPSTLAFVEFTSVTRWLQFRPPKQLRKPLGGLTPRSSTSSDKSVSRWYRSSLRYCLRA